MSDIVLNPILMTSIPVIIGVVQVFKKVGLSGTLAPLVSLILGLGVASFSGEGTVIFKVLSGLVAGLSASGLYDNGKTALSQ